MTQADPKRPLVLVTGAQDRLARAVSAALAEDHDVVGLAATPDVPDFAGKAVYPVDLTSDASTEAALEHVRARHGAHIASVVHLATHRDWSGDDHPLYQELNVNGTRRLLRSLDPFQVEQVVYASSVLVLRAADGDEPLVETSPTEASWAYPGSLIEAEAALRESRGRIPVTILRLADVYDDACHATPLAQQIHRIYQRKLESLFFPGNPEHGRQPIHIDDAVQAFRKAIDRRHALDPVALYLVAGPALVTYAELQDAFGELLHGKAWPTIRLPSPVAKAAAWLDDKLGADAFIKPWLVDVADAHYPVSLAKAKADLDFTPTRRLDDALPKMVAALEHDPERWYAEHGIRLPASVEP